VFAVTMLSAIAAGGLGSVLALWREKTFQTLALTVLVLVFWLAGWEAVARGALGPTISGFSSQTLAQGFSPWQAILEATRPMTEVRRGVAELHHPGNLFLLMATLATVVAQRPGESGGCERGIPRQSRVVAKILRRPSLRHRLLSGQLQ